MFYLKEKFLECDPIFKKSNYKIEGDHFLKDSICIFSVDEHKYVLDLNDEIKDDENLLFKIATFLFYQPTNKNGKTIIYFIGDINLYKDVELAYYEYIIKIASLDLIKEWYPNSLYDINEKIIKKFLEEQRIYGKQFCINDYDPELLYFVPRYFSDIEKTSNNVIEYFKNNNGLCE